MATRSSSGSSRPPTLSTFAQRVCIDVSEVERAIQFYTQAFGLTVGRRIDTKWVELLGGPVPIDLLENRAGSSPVQGSERVRRDYERHWTPVHLDFMVQDIEAWVQRAVDAGATQEGDLRAEPYGRMVVLADPFGNGFCFVELLGEGYDVLAKEASR
jgi:predicted enzyme related to lactoylglutathione lyase